MRQARLELLSRPGWDQHTPNILRAVVHHPHLLEPLLGFASALAARGVLPRRESELLALRAAWNCRSEFEWGHHVLYARAAGLSEDEIAAVAIGSAAPVWSDADQTLLRAADELHAQQSIGDATWAALAARWSAAQLVEIAFVVGQYTMLSMVAGALAVPLEDGLPQLPRHPEDTR
jgi:alkylhydroperoxidase family enzyme